MPIHVFGCRKSGATTRVNLSALEVVGAFGSLGSGGEDGRYEDPVLLIEPERATVKQLVVQRTQSHAVVHRVWPAQVEPPNVGSFKTH